LLALIKKVSNSESKVFEEEEITIIIGILIIRFKKGEFESDVLILV